VGLGRLLGCGEQHVVAVYAEHGAQLQARRGDGDSVHSQVPRAAQIGVGDNGAGAGAGRQAGDQLDPALVVLLAQHRCLAADRVDTDKPDGALVT